MKKSILLLTVFFLLTGISNGDVITDPVKWSQPPDFQWGYDIYSEETFGPWIADDFRCSSGNLPVTDIHWWGSYMVDLIVKPAAFVVEFYTDVPADPSDPASFSHPGQSIYWKLIPFNASNETDTGQVGWDGREVYQYFVDLPEPFLQQTGIIYWISIRGWTPQGAVPTWGWHTSAAYHWNDDAVTGPPPGANWTPLVYPQNHPFAGVTVDMAFELTTVPLPTALILFGSGLIGVAGLRKRFSK